MSGEARKMSLLIRDLPKVKIVSPFGERYRRGRTERHLGIDVRVIDGQYRVHDVIAPEDIEVTDVKYDKMWGHYIFAKPLDKNTLGIDGFEFWHIVPGVKKGDIVKGGDILGKPESGYVDLHLHFVTKKAGVHVDPVKYLKLRDAEME